MLPNHLARVSMQLWLSKSIEPVNWVKTVIAHFQANSMCSVMAFDCIVNWPLLIRTNEYLQLCGRVLDTYFLFDPVATAKCLTDTVGGYDQELVIVRFLEERYCRPAFTPENMSLLKRDIQYMYDLSLVRGDVHPCIKYIQDRVNGGTTLPDVIQSICWMPLHPDILHAVFEYGRWLAVLSKWNMHKSTDTLVQMTLMPILLDTEQEWNVVNRCKRLCGHPWRKHPYCGPAVVQYGKYHWEWDWKSTHVSYKGKCYHERVDERIQWTSIWLLQMTSGTVSLGESPKQLLAAVANSLH